MTCSSQAVCLCELNVIEQAVNVCQTTAVQGAWERGQKLMVHGWCYSLQDGLVKPLHLSVNSPETLQTAYDQALGRARAS